MRIIRFKKYLISALSFLFAFVLSFAVWAGLKPNTNKANAAGETYSLTFVDTTLIETGFGIWDGGATPSFVEENAISGNAVKVDATATGGFAALEVFPGKTVTAGEIYHIRFKVKGDGTSFHLYQNQEKWELVDDWITSTEHWVEYSYNYVVSNTTSTYGLLMCQIAGIPSASGSFYIDDMSVERTKTVTNGSVIGELPALANGLAWKIDGQEITANTVWNYTENKTAVPGTPAARYSLKFVDTSLIETGFGVWNGGNATPSFVTENAISGSAIKVDAKATGGFAALEVFPGKTVTAGDTYHIRFKVKGDGTSFHLFQNQASWELIDDWINTTSEWVEYSYDYTVANTTSEYGLFLCQIAGLPSASGSFYIDDMSVEKTKTVAEGSAIGELPALSVGSIWKIDGQEITANTVWNYAEDKTAVIGMPAAKYSLKFVDTTLIESGFGIWDGGNATPSFVTENAISGSAVKVEAKAVNGYAALEVFPGKTVTAGDTYHIRFKVKGDGTSFHLFQNQASWELIDDWINTTSEWVEYSYDYTVANSTSEYGLFLCQIAGLPSASGCFYIDDMSVEKTKTVTEGSAIGELPALAQGGSWEIDGQEITASTVWDYTEGKTATAKYVTYYTLTFDGVETRAIAENTAIGALPAVPQKAGYTNGRWTIDGEEITAETTYTYGENKTAVAVYDKLYTLSFDYAIGAEDKEVEGFTGWAGVSYTTENTVHGSAVVFDANANYFQKQFAAETFTAGETYTLSFWAKTENASGLQFSTFLTGAGIAWQDYATTTITTNIGWTYYSYDFIATAATALEVGFRAYAGSATVYLDEIYVRQPMKNGEDRMFLGGEKIGALPTVENKDGYKIVWTIDGEEITENTVFNYNANKTALCNYVSTRFTLSFEYPIGMADGEVENNGYNLGAKGTIEYVTEGTLYGSAIKYTINETGVVAAYVAKSFDVEAGKTYVFSYYMNVTESNSLEMSVYVEGSAITASDNFTDAVSGVTNGWVYREKVFTPNTSGAFIVYFRAGHGGGGNGTVYIDEIYVREKLSDPITVTLGETIDTLPAVPEIEGYTNGRWTVDGEIINADTVWMYEENKTATFIYTKLYTLTFGDTGETKQLAEGETLGELPAIPVKEGYVGSWRINGREITANTVWNYNENLTATIEYQINLGVDVEISMEEGASVRVSTDGKSGIRFETHFDKASYDALVEKYGEENIETGTFIVPYALIGNNGIYAYVTDSNKIAGTHYVQVINEGWYNEATAATDGYYKWYGSLVKIKPQNYALNFVGIGYVKVTVGEEVVLILAGEATLEDSRSIYQVAYKAYIDEDNGLSDDGMTVLENYLNEVAVFVSNGDKSAPVLDDTLESYGYEPTYTISQSAETGNYIVTAANGKTINALIIDSIAYKVEPANVIYFSYYKGTATVLSGDEVSAMNATIVTASELENGVQATYTDAAWTSYKVQNQNMSLTHGLKSGNVQVSNLTNSAGASYLTNTLDAYVVSGGNRVYGKTGSNTYGGTEAGSARLNTINLGYYYYEASVRDITFSSDIPLYLSKTYHAYSDKLHQEFTVVANGTTSNLTALGFEMKIPMSSVAKYVVDGVENASVANVTEYVGFDINGVGVLGIIVAGDTVSVTLTNDGTNYIVRQEKAMSNLSKAADGEALTAANTMSLWNRLYTDETHAFDGIKAANNEEQNPLTAANITVSTEDGGSFNGYDYATGAYSFAIDGADFNTSYNNPYNQFTESITINNVSNDRTIYIRVKADKAVEGAAIMDENGIQLPISVQVGKNFQTEYEEPNFDPTDAQWGITVAPIRVEKEKSRTFTVVNAMQKWGEFDLKQLSSISYYIGYYHLSTGVTETNCIAPYFSYSQSLGSFGNAWILPDFRGGDTMWDSEPQYDSVGILMGVTNGASTGMDDNYYGTDLGVYVGSEILSSGMTHADVEYSYVSANGDYEYTYRHVEMPQTDEARTYYTLTLKFLKDTSIDNTAFNLFSFSARDVKLSSYEYLNTSGTVVTGSNPTKASTGALFWKESVQAIYPLYKGGSYFALYGVNDKTKQNGNFGLIVKDYTITVNGANSDLGLAFKNDFISETQVNLAGLTLASSTDFKAGDTISLNVILLPYDKNVSNPNNVRKVYQDSVVNPLTVTATTGSVVADTWLATVNAKENVACFTLSGGVDTTDALSDGADSVNYTVKVTGCTKLAVPVIEEYVNGVWQTYTVASINGYDGYSVERNADGTLTYSFVIAKSTADRTFRVNF